MATYLEFVEPRKLATTSAGFAIIAPLIRRFLEHDASGNVAGLKRLLEKES